MPKRSSEETINLTVFCRQCKRIFDARLHLPHKRVESRNLTRHITSSPPCLAYYSQYEQQKKNSFDFTRSLNKNDIYFANQKKRKQLHSSSGNSSGTSLSKANTSIEAVAFDLTGTANGPCSPHRLGFSPSKSRSIVHSNLNRQTLYTGNVPLVCRKNIESSLNQHRQFEASAISTPHSLPTFEIDSESESESDESIVQGNTSSIATIDINTSPVSSVKISLTAEIELMNILRKIKAPLNAYHSIFSWAIRSQNRTGFDFKSFHSPRSRTKILMEAQSIINPDNKPNSFIPTTIKWLPDNKAVDVYVRSFQSALIALLSKRELFQERNISLPNIDSPFSYKNNPEVDVISELHHGTWWANSWKDSGCSPENNEMLVPIILYMDGISLDANGRLTLTPLNMTLGIFNTVTRRSSTAWETLYFHPDAKYMSSLQSLPTQPIDNIKNLHRGLEAALSSFKEQGNKPIEVSNFPWNGTTYSVKMKFAIAFVIGDTKQHDELCARFGGRNGGVNYICRHCKCPTSYLIKPSAQKKAKLWTPDELCHSISDDKQYWTDVSHHQVRNAFHDLYFGSNKNNIHFATPGECLHMVQLGIAKRSIESFQGIVSKKKTQKTRLGNESMHFPRFLPSHDSTESRCLISLTGTFQKLGFPLKYYHPPNMKERII